MVFRLDLLCLKKKKRKKKSPGSCMHWNYDVYETSICLTSNLSAIQIGPYVLSLSITTISET